MSETPKGRYLAGLLLAALGIVYGDIGTSPLYAVRESFHPTHGLAVTPANILGVLSLIFWSLVLVISVKYLGFILRADNRGEGGILALAALATPMGIKQTGGRPWLIALGLFGTALLYGDGAITPAVSVLSAVEGLEVATPFLSLISSRSRSSFWFCCSCSSAGAPRASARCSGRSPCSGS